VKTLDITTMVNMNKESWERTAERFFGRTALPEYGPYALNEGQLNLLGNVSGKKVLDIGCGSGHSLQYMGIQKSPSSIFLLIKFLIQVPSTKNCFFS
jgi:2-polyprenyl-3-methyl-5-hydroxy-6-metoxy-1,4-benzoquinol methylase